MLLVADNGASTGAAPWLADIVVRIDYNGFYRGGLTTVDS